MAFSLFSLMLKPGQAGTAVWGRGELFPLGVFYAAACRGLGKRIHALWGGRKGESALASYRCTEAFSLLPAWSGGYPTRKRLSMMMRLARRLPA